MRTAADFKALEGAAATCEAAGVPLQAAVDACASVGALHRRGLNAGLAWQLRVREACAVDFCAAGGDVALARGMATVVDAEATGRAALALLAELREQATATAAAPPREAVAVAPPDLWAPEAVLARAQAAQLRE